MTTPDLTTTAGVIAWINSAIGHDIATGAWRLSDIATAAEIANGQRLLAAYVKKKAPGPQCTNGACPCPDCTYDPCCYMQRKGGTGHSISCPTVPAGSGYSQACTDFKRSLP